MLQKTKAEKIFQKAMAEYDQGIQKEILYLKLIRDFKLDSQKGMQGQIEKILERKLTPKEKEKVSTLNFLKHHARKGKYGVYLRILLVFLIFFVAYQTASHIPLRPQISMTPIIDLTSTVTPIKTENAIYVTQTSTPTITSVTPTPSAYPTPFTGELRINLPAGFKIVQWHDDYIQCDKNPNHHIVKIRGLVILGGAPPYTFNFWQPGKSFTPVPVTPIPPIIQDNSPQEVILFNQPVDVEKGKYINVTISFVWENREATWKDDLYYPLTSQSDCD